MSNQILIKHPENWGLNLRLVEDLMGKALKKRNLTEVEVSLVFVGRKKAKDLNIKYRGKTYIPQVLGFPMDKEVGSDGLIHLGDIVVCTQKLKYEARFQKKKVNQILRDWLLHGVDNLLM